ncbi:hypothetical protein MHB40_03185 [Lysinibacillus sp. FSL K6-0057]|uniref:hypothetical protein n=1 Tax=Lysinibacillus sp. FSL K6-0057 TaxID=2921411 RepID=UPI00315A2E7B
MSKKNKKCKNEKVELGVQAYPAVSKNYTTQFNMDSPVYDGIDSEFHTLVLGGLKIETGSIADSDIPLISPKVLNYMGNTFPNLELVKVNKMENNEISLEYRATEMEHYGSFDWLIKCELEAIHESLEQLIVDNLLTDVKLAIDIYVNY